MILSEDHEALRDAVRRYVKAEVRPLAAQGDREHRFPQRQLAGLAEMGCLGVTVPEAWGGAGLDHLALSLVLEEIAAGDGAVSTIVSVNNCPVCSILARYGSDEQKQRWLVPLASGRMIGAFALTEPHTGSDAAALRTTARRDGGHWVLNGSKQFITSGRNGQVVIVIAQTDPALGKKGMAAFIVPTDAPGYHADHVEQKMGQRASDTAQLRLADCRVSAGQMIGQPGEGLAVALSGLEGGRIGIASQAIGMARAAFEIALAYSRERSSFGKPLFEHQAVQFMLAEMSMQIDLARQMVWHAAVLRDAGRPCIREAATAKLYASEMAEAVTSNAMQVLGGYGYTVDYEIERIYRDVRVCRVYEGTSEVQKMLIARHLQGPSSSAYAGRTPA